MQKAIIEAERKGAVVDVPDPQPKSNWVVVKVHTAPMCTEYKAFVGGHPAGTVGP